LFLVKSWTLPIPENNVELQSSWTTIWYQWYAGKSTLNILKVFNWWLDPVDQTPYTYRINASKRAYQIMWFLENWNVAYNFLSQANAAANLINRFPISKWKVLGILLEQTTNIPLQDIRTWVVDVRIDTWAVDMYVTNTIKKSWKINELYWTMENMASSQKYDKPQTNCPTWFILVPWNMDFWQPAFCVAKYEMSYADVATNTWTSTVWWVDWNTIAYTWTKVPVSMAWRLPIADIKQGEAISSCQNMWPWYHLITNNEWMTIARNIEAQPINWSWWVVWTNYIFNLVSDSNMWCWKYIKYKINIHFTMKSLGNKNMTMILKYSMW